MNSDHTISLPIIIWTADFDENSGGSIVLHTLAHRLREMGQDVYLANEVTLAAGKAKGLLSRMKSVVKHANRKRLARRRGRRVPSEPGLVVCHPTMPVPTFSGQATSPCVVVYPEVTNGNPIRAPHVVRWLLHKPGFHLGGVRHGDDELTFSYQAAFAEGVDRAPSDNLLQVRWLRTDIYRDEGASNRKGRCRMVRKGAATFNPDMGSGDDAPLLDGKSHTEIAAVFNRCEFFYCHDPYTLYLYYAALCGCVPIVVPQPGLDATTWRSGFELKRGVAYGEEEIPFAIATREWLFSDMNTARQAEDEAVRKFIAKTKAQFGC